MALVSLKDMLLDARKKKYAVIATDAFNFDYAEAVIRAAEEKNSPVILQLAEGLFKFFNFDKLVGPVMEIAKEAKVPVVVNLDHGENFDVVMKAIRSGLNSVMFDGSKLSLDENIEVVSTIVKVAHSLDVSVEAEVGVVGGLEGNVGHNDRKVDKNLFTKPEDALHFHLRTDADALAVAVGTIHGFFKGDPEIDFDRILKIKNIVDVPLVLHGGSGLSDDDFKKAIKNGITKINYFTNLVDIAAKKARDVLDGDPGFSNYAELNYLAMEALKEEIKNKMDLFGSTNRSLT
jgi:fructose-bisphosphate aldolase class II